MPSARLSKAWWETSATGDVHADAGRGADGAATLHGNRAGRCIASSARCWDSTTVNSRRLVARWNISPKIEAALPPHRTPGRRRSAEASALHIATRFAAAASCRSPPRHGFRRSTPACGRSGSVHRVHRGIKQEADRELEALAQAILPGFAADDRRRAPAAMAAPHLS